LGYQSSPFSFYINPPWISSDHNSFDALRPASAEMETTEERLARPEEEVAHFGQELQKVKEEDAGTGKHANHVQS
jgi:hypothetical protein